jgi:acyl-CoA thioester hydrolase
LDPTGPAGKRRCNWYYFPATFTAGYFNFRRDTLQNQSTGGTQPADSASTRPAGPERIRPAGRGDFPHFLTITTRWMDNDAYGHINNVVYYSYFDTVVNAYLIGKGVLEIGKSAAIGLVVETGCHYFSSLAYPDVVHAGLRVARLGGSSVRYEIGIFGNAEPLSAARGHFVHVYVDQATRRPVPLPAALRAALEPLLVQTPTP